LEPDSTSWTRPLLATKLRPPAPGAGKLARPRVAAALDRALNDDVRLTLVSAPPGYGKTVALTSWLASGAAPHAWLSLDPADNDPVRFLHYLVGSLECVRPGITEALGAAFSAGGVEAGERLIDAVSRADDRFVLVLDDYHVITAEPVHEIVRLLIAQGPPFMHLVVLAREDPPLPLARLRAQRTLVELRAADLRFTLEEAAEYLGGSPDLELDAPHVTQLVERTEGWIAGIQLAAITLRGRPDAAALVEDFAGSQRFVFDYLAAETLDRLEPDLCQFLARISVAGRFTAELAAALTGRTDSAALLELAERLNLFLVPLDLERRWYRFHHLFADYLRSLLDDAEGHDLHARAAGWFERAGLIAEAIEQALLAADVDRALGLVESTARATYEAGEFATLLGWIDALPRERLGESPELLTRTVASLVLLGRLGDAARAGPEAEAALLQHGQPTNQLAAVRALLAARLGQPQAGRLARSALASLPEGDEFRAFALNALGSVELGAGDLRQAGAAMSQALEASLVQHQPILAVLAASRLAAALDLEGRRGEAETWCRRTLAEFGLTEGAIRGGPAYVAWRLGMLRYEANDLPGASQELERAWLGLASVASLRAGVGLAVADIALVRLALGYPDLAIEAIEAVRGESDATWQPSIADGLAEIEARIRLWSGDLAAAAVWADRTEPAVGSGWLGLPFEMTLARVRLAQRRTAEALDHLHQARAAAHAAGDVADLITVRVLDAVRADQAGAQAAARQAVEEAVHLAAPGWYARRLIDDGRPVAHLLPAVRRFAPPFVDSVLGAMSNVPGTGLPALRAGRQLLWQDEHGALVEALTARELEVLRLMAAGLGDAAIAEALVVSLATAKWHAAHVRAKLHARSRTQALARARDLGLV
jgi:LuxR family maltose regulon positive regulatory protein